MTGVLAFGVAGMAYADTLENHAPATTTLAQATEDDSDNTGLWGLTGLLGLLGLLGLKRRNDRPATGTADTNFSNTPRT